VLWVEKVFRASSCNFSTDTKISDGISTDLCKFSTEEIVGAQNLTSAAEVFSYGGFHP